MRGDFGVNRGIQCSQSDPHDVRSAGSGAEQLGSAIGTKGAVHAAFMMERLDDFLAGGNAKVGSRNGHRRNECGARRFATAFAMATDDGI